MIRGYDTFKLYCDDTIIRIKYGHLEIAVLQQKEKELLLSLKKTRKWEKSLGIIDPPESPKPKTERKLKPNKSDV